MAKRQRHALSGTVATSTQECELRALFTAATLIVYIKQFFTEVGFPYPKAVVLWEDNTAARDFSVEEMHQSRAKHLEIKFTFIRELILKNVLEVRYIHTEQQLADIFTKALDRVAFYRHASTMMTSETSTEHHGGVSEQQ